MVRKLGEGESGVLYEALDHNQNKTVALKILGQPDQEGRFRLKDQFRRLAGLRHPNLVALHDLFADERPPFFTMEYVSGNNFVSHVTAQRDQLEALNLRHDLPPGQRQLACDEAKLRHLLPQMAAALAALHQAGQLHHDLKPNNVLVTSEGQVKLIDYGLAPVLRELNQQSQEESFTGTVAYMSPEQAAEEPWLGPASDWYSLGVLLFEALTGRLPHQGSLLTTLIKKTQEAPPPVRQLVPDVPEDLDQLVNGLLRRDPEKRIREEEVLERLGIVGPSEPARGKTNRPPAEGMNPFQGRTNEIRLLWDAFLAVRDTRQAHTLVLSGPSGIGKTVLVAEFLARVSEAYRGTVVLRGRCYEWESVSYKAMDALIDDLSRYWSSLPQAAAMRLLPRRARLLPALFPALGRVDAVAGSPRFELPTDPPERQRRAYAALKETLQRLTEPAPAILFIDDMQWADGDSATLLAELVSEPESPAVLFVVATREEGLETGSKLSALLAELGNDGRILSVPPLSASEGTALANSIIGTSREGQAATIAAEAQGNPFFITELSRYAAQRPRQDRAPTVDGLISSRVLELDEDARTLLEVLVVAGEPVPRRSAAAAASLGPYEFADAAKALRSVQLARTAGTPESDHIECYHDRVREAVSGQLTEERGAELHRALAEALEAGGQSPPEQLAHHFRGAGDKATAAMYAEQAAAAASRVQRFARASELYGIALAQGQQDKADRRRLLRAQGTALRHAGRPTEAASAWEQALAVTTDSDEILELRRRIAESWLAAGDYARGREAAAAAAATVGLRYPKNNAQAFLSVGRELLAMRRPGAPLAQPDEERTERLRAKCSVCHSLGVALPLLDPLRSMYFSLHWLRLARAMGEPAEYARAQAIAATTAASTSTKARATRYLDSALQLGEAADDDLARVYVSVARLLVTFLADNDWPAVLACAEESRRIWPVATRGDIPGLEIVDQFELFSLRFLGEYRRIFADGPRRIARASRAGKGLRSLMFRVYLSDRHLAAGDAARAQWELDQALGNWTSAGDVFLFQHYHGLVRRAEIALWRNEPREAQSLLASTARRIRHSLLLRVKFSSNEYDYLNARVALACAAQALPRSERGRLLRRASSLARRLDASSLPLGLSYALMIRAAMAGLRDQKAESITLLRQALARLKRSRTMGYFNVAKRHLGVVLGGEEGTTLVTEADLWLSRQGIKEPARFAAMMLPGWAHPDS
jgi:hypothetical protein